MLGLYEQLPVELMTIPDVDDFVLKGDTPYAVLIQSIAEQFDEFMKTGYIHMDTTNYIDQITNALNLSKQINTADIDEHMRDDGTLREIKERIEDVLFVLMDAIGVDLSQAEDPINLSYQLYTNFMLVDQRQPFFNYIINNHVKHDGLEGESAIAYGRMLEGDPKELYSLTSDMFSDPVDYLAPFLRDTGFPEIYELVEIGSIPASVMIDTFLRQTRIFSLMFVEYYQSEREAKMNQDD